MGVGLLLGGWKVLDLAAVMTEQLYSSKNTNIQCECRDRMGRT